MPAASSDTCKSAGSDTVTCVRSILLDSTAYICSIEMACSCGLGRLHHNPLALPIAPSAADNLASSRGSLTNSGGNGGGT